MPWIAIGFFILGVFLWGAGIAKFNVSGFIAGIVIMLISASHLLTAFIDWI